MRPNGSLILSESLYDFSFWAKIWLANSGGLLIRRVVEQLAKTA